MVPIAMGVGADVQFRSPMAIAGLGGLISSTFLSLLYIPAIFTIVDDIAGLRQHRIPTPHFFYQLRFRQRPIFRIDFDVTVLRQLVEHFLRNPPGDINIPFFPHGPIPPVPFS